MIDETMQAMNGKVVIEGKHYKEWVNKIMTIGLDIVFNLKTRKMGASVQLILENVTFYKKKSIMSKPYY